jgi:hypothetical protein
MKNYNWLAALSILSLAAACGGEIGEDVGTDDLSDSTYSMEMVRANPALLPSAKPAEGVKTNGRPRPLSAGDLRGDEGGPDGFGFGRVDEHHWLYAANQLDQFSKLPDPALHKDDIGTATHSRQPGDLFASDNKFVWTDVEQGHLGDCYFAASLAAVVFADKAGTVTKNMIVPRTEGGKVISYYVNFYQASGRKVRIEVDPDLPHRNSSGKVLYMRSTQTKAGYEEWAPSLVEKAYAKWHRTYNAIGNGGTAGDAIYALTGKTTRYYTAKDSRVVAAIEAAGKNGKAQAACTYGDKDGVTYPKGLHSDHCYTLRGIKRTSGKVFVQLRNPWGPGLVTDEDPTEPLNLDGVPDGLFDLPLADFQKLYASVDIVP